MVTYAWRLYLALRFQDVAGQNNRGIFADRFRVVLGIGSVKAKTMILVHPKPFWMVFTVVLEAVEFQFSPCSVDCTTVNNRFHPVTTDGLDELSAEPSAWKDAGVGQQMPTPTNPHPYPNEFTLKTKYYQQFERSHHMTRWTSSS